MRSKALIGLVFITSLAVGAADKAQPLKVNLGLWEVTTIATSSPIPIPVEVLARLTPEQRARVEERMKARFSDRIKPKIRRQCLTKEALKKGTAFGEDRKSCSRTGLAATATKMGARIECINHGVESNGTFEVEALDPKNVTGSIHLISTGGDNPINSTSTFTARWIGPVCK